VTAERFTVRTTASDDGQPEEAPPEAELKQIFPPHVYSPANAQMREYHV
jgi:hypothetical protein